MTIAMKYVGTGENNTRIAQNNNYIVLAIFSGSFLILDDNKDLYGTNNGITSTSQWQPVSITDFGAVQLFP